MSKPPAPTMGALFTFSFASRSCGPAGWLALLLIKVDDVETYPGPTTYKQVWIYDISHKQIHGRKQRSIRCNWVTKDAPSTIHRYLDLPSTQMIQTHNSHRTPFQTLVPKPPTHSPPTPQQAKHTSNTPAVPSGLEKPRPKPLIHSPHSSPTPPESNKDTFHTFHQLLLSYAPHSSIAPQLR